MNKIKTTFIYLILIVLIGYLSFLFILPNFLNLNKYTKLVEDAFFKTTGYSILLNNPKISTSPDLHIMIGVEKSDIYDNKTKFAQINDLKINISILPLINKTLKITNISASKFIVEVPKNLKSINLQKSDISLFEKLPDININYYRISLKNGKNIYSVKGKNFKFFDNPLFKKSRIITQGGLLTNKNEHVKYDINIAFQIPKKIEDNDYYKLLVDVFSNFNTYSLKSKLFANVDASNLSDVKGNIKLSDFSIISNNKRLPASFVNLALEKDNVKINSDIYTINNDKIEISGNLNYGKNKNIDLKILTNKVQLQDILTIAKTFTNSFGINSFDNIIANGLLKSNFSIKSDFNKISSSGNLLLQNGFLKYDSYSLKDINANIDFSNNKITIDKAVAKFGNYPITLNGTIDKIVNLTISANNLKIKDFVDKNILKDYKVDGIAKFNAYIKGDLKEILPFAELRISNVSILSKDGMTSVIVPNFIAKLKDNVITLEKGFCYIDNVRTEISGSVSNILNKPVIDIIKIHIPNQVNVAAPLKSRISVNGDVVLSGSIENPKIKGNINIPKISIPSDGVTIQNVLLIADNGIKINCPYININSSILRLTAFLDNLTEVKNINVNAEYIDINKIKTFSKKQYFIPNIVNGTLKINKVKVNDIIAENVISKIEHKNNILRMNNLMADAYQGKIAANISYDIKRNKTSIDIQGRNLDSYNLFEAISGKVQDIKGRCDFDSNLSFIGDSQIDIQNTINGNVKIIIYNLVSGNLGKLDYLIQAQNILSNKVLHSSLNMVKNALKLKDNGIYRTAKGELYLNNGCIYIKTLKLAGPYMSLFINGRYYILSDSALLSILGRVSNEVVSALGPLGKVTDSSYHPSIGKEASLLVSDITKSDLDNVSNIPELTVKTQFNTQEFKVLFNGKIDKETSVQSFKWIKK